MAAKLCLRFPEPNRVIVELYGTGPRPCSSEPVPFASPLAEAAQEDLHWYLEVYPGHYAADLDDAKAARIEVALEGWGRTLFNAVFGSSHTARQIFDDFARDRTPGRLLTIDSDSPAVLAQPWELLRHPHGTWLFLENPRVGVCRRISGEGATEPFKINHKEHLHLLFVVSRPGEEGFIDPRTDPRAVMDALERHAPGRFTVEFLRPPTLAGLIERLEDEGRPGVDILHFDGHGVYDPDGRLAREAARVLPPEYRDTHDGETGGEQGYLLFEDPGRRRAPVSAAVLGRVFRQGRVGLVVLSACESAKVGGEDPLGGVAARLTWAGVPAVLAMTHSVLPATTAALFRHFYGALGRGQPVGAALAETRWALREDRCRGERRRSEGWITLRLQDWFLPTLYQAGADRPLLTVLPTAAAAGFAADVGTDGQKAPGDTPAHSDAEQNDASPPAADEWGELLPAQVAGFWGRATDLWEIEWRFAAHTRRLVIHGFGGQGTTALAAEAGRWLQRTGMFEQVCFVGYAGFQGVDPVGFAVAVLAQVLGQSLIDADAATRALAATPTLVILDNLEDLADPDAGAGEAVSTTRGPSADPTESQDRDPSPLTELLTAATLWSEAGGSRVLVTTRAPDLGHPGFPTEGDLGCRYLKLDGLREQDALDWFQSLFRLPPNPLLPSPTRETLIDLFGQVAFHPLSIAVLARELKTRRPTELGERLTAILAEDTDPLRASLNLSIERLSPEARALLPRLGVFHGGSFEGDLLAVTEFSPEEWASLRTELTATGLIQVERVPDVGPPYLRFHPTLAPMLWERLGDEVRAPLAERFREVQYRLVNFLYDEDFRNARYARALARRALPNLLAALDHARAAGAPEQLQFSDRISRFLNVFGCRCDQAELPCQFQTSVGAVGSDAWFLGRIGKANALLDAGRLAEAGVVFETVVAGLGDAPSYGRCLSLRLLGNCYRSQRLTREAETILLGAIGEAGTLERSDAVRRELGALQTELGDTLTDGGDYPGARAAYEVSLTTYKALADTRSRLAVEVRLASLAYLQCDLADTVRRCREILPAIRALDEPAPEAAIWHQLGMAYAKAEAWEEAERAYREAAEIKERLGDFTGPNGAATTWDQLAQLIWASGRPAEAEGWYRKALTAWRQVGDPGELTITLSNLSSLLRALPNRLCEARRLAEQALALGKNLDPAAANIWTVYYNLAEIATQQGDEAAALAYRREEHATWAAFPGSRMALRPFGPMIAEAVDGLGRYEARELVDALLDDTTAAGLGRLTAALQRAQAGERDRAALCEPLGHMEAAILSAILDGLADPASIADLLPPQSGGSD